VSFGARPRSPAVPRRAVHGVLLLDKPLGLSSNDALQKAKRLFRAEKAGHTGTLDPLATGLLPLCFGAATKFSQVSLDADKRYRATLKLGITTSTADAEGDVLQRADVNVSRDMLQSACVELSGEIDQVPPMHSALKHEGKPLYEYARAGIELERQPRRVTLHSIVIADVEDQGRDDCWTLDVHCSKGTYIRTLAEDIGKLLGCGAHLSALRRTGSGVLSLQGALTLEQLAAMTEADRDATLLDADALLADWPLVRLREEDAGRFLSGVRRRLPLADMPNVRVYGPQPRAFLGSGHVLAGELISSRLLSPIEVQGLLTPMTPSLAAPALAPSFTKLVSHPVSAEVSQTAPPAASQEPEHAKVTT
jgi:tRNA pseudouridine55 synthase